MAPAALLPRAQTAHAGIDETGRMEGMTMAFMLLSTTMGTRIQEATLARVERASCHVRVVVAIVRQVMPRSKKHGRNVPPG